MALYILLESVVLHEKLSIFWALNITFYLWYVGKSFPLGLLVFLILGFRVLFG